MSTPNPPPVEKSERPAPPPAAQEASKTAADKRSEGHKKAADETALSRKAVDAMAEVTPTGMMPFTPTDFAGAWKLADFLSKSGIVADGLAGNAGACFAVMARGSLMGMQWAVAVTEAHVVHGRVGWPAAVMDALIDTSPAFEYFEVFHADNEKAIIEAKKHRWSEPRRYEFTIEDAEIAGYLNTDKAAGQVYSQVWQKRRKLMLIAAARREAARMWDPARFAGMYTPEELAGSPRAFADAPKATAALESFGAQPALTSGEPEVVHPPTEPDTESPDVFFDRKAKGNAGRVHLTERMISDIRKALEGPPKLTESALIQELGKPLAEFSFAPGSKPEELYAEVRKVVKELRKAAEKK